MTHQEKIHRWLPPDVLRIGTEIGAGAAPIPGLDPAPIYIDCFKSFGATANHADYYGHATALPFQDHALDYVIASHVLEHVANPVAALAEWYRVVKPGGLIYLVVPDRRTTWDRRRALTTVEHLLEDFTRGTTASDPTHIDEFALNVDWTDFSPNTPAEEIPTQRATLARGLHETIARGEDINIHFHTFEPANLRALLHRVTASAQPRRPHAPATPAQTIAASPPTASSVNAPSPSLTALLPSPHADFSATAAADRPAPTGPHVPGAPLSPRLLWEIVDFAEAFPSSSPNGVLAILRVHKGWRARADAAAFHIRAKGERLAMLRPEAQPFGTWAMQTAGLGGVR